MKAVLNGRDAAQQTTIEGLTHAQLKAVHRTMLYRRCSMTNQLKNQSQISFKSSGAGHEAICVAAGLTCAQMTVLYYATARSACNLG
jgi:hypothetical protein